MNKKDYKKINETIESAEAYKKMYKELNNEQDFYFWSGYLNALKLLRLQAKNNYKID